MASKIEARNGECKASIIQLRDGTLHTELVTRRGDFISKLLSPFINPGNFKAGDVIVITVTKVKEGNYV